MVLHAAGAVVHDRKRFQLLSSKQYHAVMNNSDLETTRILQTELFARLPPEWPDDPTSAIQTAVRASGTKVVVIDDDPTGTQTVYGVPVLTEWSVEQLRDELANELPALYLLTNSRSLPLTEAQLVNAQIGHNLAVAARQADRPFVVVSRSDSTLRGHFPGEVDALAAALGQDFDAWLLVPFFRAGGRYTIDDTHYVAEGEWLVPAGETEFARDAAFGYRESNLRRWVEEKTAGRIPFADVASISLEDIRHGGPDRVAARLLALRRGVCVVNAASDRDLDIFVVGLLSAEARGRRYLYRTAASFVAARAALPPRPLLARVDLELPASGGGLIVVGSYVPKTSGQVSALLAQPGVLGIELDVAALLSDNRQAAEIARAAGLAEQGLCQGEDVVLVTSRALVGGTSAEQSLAIGRRVSQGLIAVLRALTTRPRYLIAKGGITSSDIATQALGVQRALVLGQILPGVPVWRLGPESRYPELMYVVFPGNVGGPQALADLVAALRLATYKSSAFAALLFDLIVPDFCPQGKNLEQ
jgi:uncharacterized protein YgbK (DUF1537 family)